MTQSTNIIHLFLEGCRRHPEQAAIIDGKQAVSFRELEAEVSKTAQYFISKGIRKGDRVLIFVPMSIDLYRIVLALFRIGAVAVFLDEWVSKKRMEACCEIAECRGFVGVLKAHVLRLFSKELRKIPIVLKLRHTQPNEHPEPEMTDSNDTALITFTTGSTGIPKAAKRTHAFLNEQFMALREKIDPQPGDVDMSLLPIVLLINLGAGATSVIARFKSGKPGAFKPALICEQITKHKVNRITASPVFIRLLSEHLLAHRKTLATVKQVFTGGAPVFPDEAALYHRAFGNARIEIVYGSTEAEPISAIQARELSSADDALMSKGLPVGKPYRKAEVKIIGITEEPVSIASEAELKLCPAGSIGEIIVAGPHVLREYINNEDALKRNKIFTGEKVYHRTGDSGWLDEEGHLFLTGRCSTIFQSRRMTVYPFLYEYSFRRIPGVSTGTVLQVGNETVAAIELRNDTGKREVEEQLKAMPLTFDRICFLDKLPRDPRHHSKIDYERLKKML